MTDDDKELLVALWTIQNAPPLRGLPNFFCWYCSEEILEKPVFFERAWACHQGECIKFARQRFGKRSCVSSPEVTK